MKKVFLLALALVTFMGVHAQTNIQEMYDFGKDRGYMTTTLEMFKPDKWGSTFFFVDFYHGGKHSPNGAYTEIARSLNFWQDTKMSPLSLHVEYNGGLGYFGDNTLYGYGINDAWLGGVDYFIHSKDFNNTLTLQVLYKKLTQNTNDIPLQLTMVWGCKDLFGLKGLTFSGFADFWWENIMWMDEINKTKTTTVFISEPQLWYNVGRFFNCENLNIGGEVEIANNFTGNVTKGWHVNPCLGVKWIF
jgi:hypothetical protein